MIKLVNANCWPALRSMENASVDAIVTDPPYGLSFMGKKWDYDVPSKELWAEVLRVLKPGGHLLSFGGTRTYHRMVVAIEDAGFEIRDQVQWLYGSGFPKSMDVSKAMDKAAGAEREVIGPNPNSRPNMVRVEATVFQSRVDAPLSKPATDAAKKWAGWGTALKPANEPICLARKPLEKGLTVAENVAKWGTGAINIDASRIGTETRTYSINKAIQGGNSANQPAEERDMVTAQGRWPANLILDETAAELLDEQSGMSKSSAAIRNNNPSPNFAMNGANLGHTSKGHADSGGASRFFYVAKASKRERNAGLEGMPLVAQGVGDERPSGQSMQRLDGRETREMQNHHPTVKPIKLMEYLIRMITPPNGVVLDCFMGSGTTGIAAKNLGFSFIGIELSEEYFYIAKKRMGES